MDNWTALVKISRLERCAVFKFPRLTVLIEPIPWTNSFKVVPRNTVLSSNKWDQKT